MKWRDWCSPRLISSIWWCLGWSTNRIPSIFTSHHFWNLFWFFLISILLKYLKYLKGYLYFVEAHDHLSLINYLLLIYCHMPFTSNTIRSAIRPRLGLSRFHKILIHLIWVKIETSMCSGWHNPCMSLITLFDNILRLCQVKSITSCYYPPSMWLIHYALGFRTCIHSCFSCMHSCIIP